MQWNNFMSVCWVRSCNYCVPCRQQEQNLESSGSFLLLCSLVTMKCFVSRCDLFHPDFIKFIKSIHCRNAFLFFVLCGTLVSCWCIEVQHISILFALQNIWMTFSSIACSSFITFAVASLRSFHQYHITFVTMIVGCDCM